MAESCICDACSCGCTDPHGASVHPLCIALADGDVDRALALGLLKSMPCPACSIECQVALVQARVERKHALAARERYRARNARLQRRHDERAARRGIAGVMPAPRSTIESSRESAQVPGNQHQNRASPPSSSAPPDPAVAGARQASPPRLPAAVEAALARAKAKAAAASPPAGSKP